MARMHSKEVAQLGRVLGAAGVLEAFLTRFAVLAATTSEDFCEVQSKFNERLLNFSAGAVAMMDGEDRLLLREIAVRDAACGSR